MKNNNNKNISLKYSLKKKETETETESCVLLTKINFSSKCGAVVMVMISEKNFPELFFMENL